MAKGERMLSGEGMAIEQGGIGEEMTKNWEREEYKGRSDDGTRKRVRGGVMKRDVKCGEGW